jgi:hypothetical protein
MNTAFTRSTGDGIGAAHRASFALTLLFLAVGVQAPVVMAQTGTFTPTGSMITARSQHTATLLLDGRVLMAGGMLFDPGRPWLPLASAELFDPSTGRFTATGSMTTARRQPSAALLPDGRVLIAGGTRSDGSAVASAELYDPSTGSFTVTGGMINPRFGHSAILLANGKVLIVGGAGTSYPNPGGAELYDPATGTFAATGEYVVEGGCCAPAILLADGKVLFALQNRAQVYDPSTGTFNLTGAPGYCLSAAALLTNRKVLFAGGQCDDRLATAELYDPVAGAFAFTGNMASPRVGHTLTLLPDGAVLAAGGETDSYFGNGFALTVASAELYYPSTDAFALTGVITAPREGHTATLLRDGRVLIAGGLAYGEIGILLGTSASAELYTPDTPGTPTVQIVDNNTGSLTTLAVGDSFSFLVTGAPPVSSVLVSEAGWSSSIGYTDPSGFFRLNGVVGSNVVGTWQQTWTIGGVLAQPSPLQFTITVKP